MLSSNRAARIFAVLAFLLTLGGACAGDEAIRFDGRRVAGTLHADDDGRLHFTAKDSQTAVALDGVQHIRFPDAAPDRASCGAPFRVQLASGQFVTGELLELDEQSLKVRSLWSNRVQLPRRAVVALTHPPGFVTLFHEDFDADPVGMKLTGAPTLDDKQRSSGRRSLRLDAVGQSTSYKPPASLDAGRCEMRFHDPSETTGGRWLAEAAFAGKHRVQVILADSADAYTVQTDLPAAETRRIARSAGWHRLSVRFHPGYLLVGVDDKLLFESGKAGPCGPLTEIRIACVAGAPDAPLRGALHFDDFTVTKSVDDLPHAAGDPTQDELWLVGGDQLFGRVLRADRRSIVIDGRFGKRTLDWSAVRGIFPKTEAVEPRTSDGEHVRLWLDSGLPQADELEGVLRAFDDRKLVLRHPLLGDLTFDRSRLRQLRPLFHGRRIELDPGRHHLGDAGRIVPNLSPPRAEGPSLRCRFRLDALPPSARLALTVHHLKPTADGGETEILVNGQRIDILNHHADRVVKDPVPVTIAVPSSALRSGENVVELRPSPNAAGQRPSCVVADLVVELPR